MHVSRRFALALVCAISLLCGCAKNATPAVTTTPPSLPGVGDTNAKIKHIVWSVMDDA